MKLIKNKGFTLIELLVTIAVLSILVLLGAPRFLGYTQKAELSRIQHDVKVMEQEIGTVLINNDDEFNKWENNSEDFNQLIQANNFFEKEGSVKKIEDLSANNTYKVIPEKYKDNINTKLKGTFYANSGGKVYYEHVKPGIEGLIEKGYIPIATAEDLDNIRNNRERTYGEGTDWADTYTGGLDKKYIQVADISLSGYSKDEGWTPIGTNSSSFTGVYDGNGHNITGLTISRPETDHVGLFGHTMGAVIRNVGLISNEVTGNRYAGVLVGYARGGSKISNSYTTGSVTGSYYVGGLAGAARENTKITNSYATGTVTGTGTGNDVGGLVGKANKSIIENSYATGSVTGTNYVGGLVGVTWSNTMISNSYATGSVEGTGSGAGGLVGQARDVTISNSYSIGEVTGNTQVGGLVGRASSVNTATNSYWDKDTTGQFSSAVGGTGKSTDEMKNKATYSGWNFNTVWKIDEGKDYPKLR